MPRITRVLVVDDSQLFRTAISGKLAMADPSIKVVATAGDAYEARDKIIEFSPDVMTLDVQMPHMNGLEFLKRLMPQRPMPVIVVSAVSGIVFDAMNAGAVDFVAKPEGGNLDGFVNELANKVIAARTARIHLGTSQPRPTPPSSSVRPPSVGNLAFNGIIALGASTGGTEATASILKVLPKDTPGTIIVQHMPPVFTKMYADRLNNSCAMSVREAKDGDKLERGLALVAPGGFQCQVVNRGGQLGIRIFEGEKVSGHCPSVDVMFRSVAENCGGKAIGIILTGMGGDGAAGLLEMRRKGSFTIGQDEKSCVVYGMPMVAYNMGAVAKQAPLDQIPGVLLNALKGVK